MGPYRDYRSRFSARIHVGRFLLVALVSVGGGLVLPASIVAQGAARPATGAAGGASPHATYGVDPSDPHAVSSVVYQGWKMFEVYCTRCHGEDAVGSSFAPALVKSVGPDGTITHRLFFETVTTGRPQKGMPTWGNLLSPEQKEDV
jgi:mono/diheme cytochrome c family protein